MQVTDVEKEGLLASYLRVTEILTLKTKTRDGPRLIGHPGPNTPTCRCGTDTEHPVEDGWQIQNNIKMDSDKFSQQQKKLVLLNQLEH